MDIIVKSVLDFIQGTPGRSNTIIAGGAIRDMIYNVTPKDYDFCIPSKNKRDMNDLAILVQKEFGVSPFMKSREYQQMMGGQALTTVWGFTFEGRQIDLIGHRQEDDEDFATEVIRKFDYGINMVYFNGSQVCDDYQDFEHDKNFHYLSLRNLDSMSSLPNAINRYHKINEKLGGDFIFRAPCLELVGSEKKERFLSTKKVFYETTLGNTPEPDWDVVETDSSIPTPTLTTVGWGLQAQVQNQGQATTSLNLNPWNQTTTEAI